MTKDKSKTHPSHLSPDGIEIPVTLPIEGLSNPGAFPYRRGVYKTMYAGRPWTVRQYGGFSTADETNLFFKKNLKQGQTGLSVAFDLATHRGYNSDHPRVPGDVGKAGVAIDTVDDMNRLFRDIPLDQVSVSMTMNGAVLPILAAFIVCGEEQGVAPEKLRGTLQNDILKEFMVRNTYIYPVAPSLRIVRDIIAYCAQDLPLFHPISISGYHMHEAGATTTQELAFTIANGMEYTKLALAAGLSIDDFAPRLSFFFAIGMDFFSEIAKLRAARQLWAEFIQGFNPKNPKSTQLRMHCQTSGVSLTAQDPLNNVVRTTLEALAGVLGGTQSLHTNAYDEALALPSESSARLARNTQLILRHEAGLTYTADPLGGSVYVEHLTDQLREKASSIIETLDQKGGMAQAIEEGYPQGLIEASAARKQALLEKGDESIVGVNCYTGHQDTQDQGPEILVIDAKKVKKTQLDSLDHIKKTRNSEAVAATLADLKQAARQESANLMPHVIDAMRLRATVGEVSDVLESVFGRYQAVRTKMTGVYSTHFEEDEAFQTLLKRVQNFEKKVGRRPRMMVAKLGQDGHDRGAKVIASAFADFGFDVDLAPLFQTPEEVAKQAIENDVHIVGISTQAGGHSTLIPDLISHLKALKTEDILVICGGIIPDKDQEALKRKGVKAIFSPNASLLKAASEILDLLKGVTV